MLNTQIATMLNTVIIPNYFGEGKSGDTPITITEDLRNIVDLGKALSDLSVNDLENFKGDLVVGVLDTYTDAREFKSDDEASYGLFVSSEEYGGAIQRVKCKLLSATDSNLLALVDASNSGPDYTDGKFYGVPVDAKIYTKMDSFRVKFSISNNELKKSFTSAAGVARLIAMIEVTVINTIALQLNATARGVLRELILQAYTGGREVKLLTMYNTIFGFTSSDPGYVDISNWNQNETFKIWCQSTILKLRKGIADYNEKYNDGTVETFTPEADSRAIFLSDFATDMDVALGSVYHTELVKGLDEYRTINFWQNGTTELVPVIKSGSLHDQIVEKVADSGDAQVTTINHVVGLLFDRFSAFVTYELTSMRVKRVEEEDFSTYFRDYTRRYCVDTRNTNVILTLS
ncbi:hypothetical protein J6V85_04100 [Candidatus Saccharibacteria bacterium]|nr:hypothetical protein [Candidatus Saccharibacteria bacterium]